MAANLTACASNGMAIVMPNGVMEELAAQADAARSSSSPGGPTVTPEERDGMEAHARARLEALFGDFTRRLDAQGPLRGALRACRNNVGIGARHIAVQAKGMVDLALRPPPAPRAPEPSQPPRGPLAPRGKVYDI